MGLPVQKTPAPGRPMNSPSWAMISPRDIVKAGHPVRRKPS